ncbi:MAG: GFA family protein [Leptolyngbyaceae cyanobacterium]|mgnify:CR=1 FL=1
MLTTTLTGGCLCGAVRYRSTKPLIDAGYCHCKICQKSCGAPVVAWVSVPQRGFAFTQGTPTEYASSAQGRRHFCPTCGTQLTFTRTDSHAMDITVTTLDQHSAIVPEYHIWTAHQAPWLTITDDLPRYLDNGPDR